MCLLVALVAEHGAVSRSLFCLRICLISVVWGPTIVIGCI